MLKDMFFAAQIALLILSGCAASDMWYRGILPGIYAAVIISACTMALYSSIAFYTRATEKEARQSVQTESRRK